MTSRGLRHSQSDTTSLYGKAFNKILPAKETDYQQLNQKVSYIDVWDSE